MEVKDVPSPVPEWRVRSRREVPRRFLTPRVIAGLLSFAAGIMTLLAGCELWPKAGRYRQPRAQYFGFLLGAAVLALTSCVV